MTTPHTSTLAGVASILPLPLSPTMSSRSGGASGGAGGTGGTDVSLHSTKQELREKSSAAFMEFSALFREVARQANVSEDLMRQAKVTASQDATVRSTGESLRRLSSTAAECQTLNTGILDRLKRLSWVLDELDLDSMTRRPPS